MIFNIPMGGKGSAVVSAYGAPGETVTLTHSNGKVFTLTANDDSTMKITAGVYTVKGSVSGFEKTIEVTKNTTRIEAWPDGATIYYWFGLKNHSGWTIAAQLPKYDAMSGTGLSINRSNKVKPTNSVEEATYYHFATTGDRNRGGSAYTGPITVDGGDLYVMYTNAQNKNHLSFNATTDVSGDWIPFSYVGVEDGSSGTVKLTKYEPDSVYSGEYYVAVSGNTSSSDGAGTGRAMVDIQAIYSM